MKFHSILQTATLLIAAFNLYGCSERSDTPPSQSNTQAKSNDDLKALMSAMAEAVKSESEVLQKAVKSLDSLTDQDRATLWSALMDQQRIAGQIQLALEANPSDLQVACESFLQVVDAAHAERTSLRRELFAMSDASNVGGAWWKLLSHAAPSEEVAREHMTYMGASPGAPDNLSNACTNLGQNAEPES